LLFIALFGQYLPASAPVGIASAPLAVMTNPVGHETVHIVRQLLEGRGPVILGKLPELHQ
jgi:hypothetical protein